MQSSERSPSVERANSARSPRQTCRLSSFRRCPNPRRHLLPALECRRPTAATSRRGKPRRWLCQNPPSYPRQRRRGSRAAEARLRLLRRLCHRAQHPRCLSVAPRHAVAPQGLVAPRRAAAPLWAATRQQAAAKRGALRPRRVAAFPRRFRAVRAALYSWTPPPGRSPCGRCPCWQGPALRQPSQQPHGHRPFCLGRSWGSFQSSTPRALFSFWCHQASPYPQKSRNHSFCPFSVFLPFLHLGLPPSSSHHSSGRHPPFLRHPSGQPPFSSRRLCGHSRRTRRLCDGCGFCFRCGCGYDCACS
mmetsp:Transcript_61131/g.171003  ORF Transcript_61131/g.171003 Transcript_61131/m.171003 type:complete len:303 (-) Transcript_61131:801-1709(-)